MKKILLLGFLLVILITIPVLIYLVGIQTKTKSKAAASTTLSFSQLNGPVNPGQNFNLDVIMDPGTNQVSFVKLIISYDKTMLQRGNPGISPNTSVFPVTLEGPTYDQCTGNTCTMSITLSIGTEITKAVQGGTPATIASVSFQPLQSISTGGTTTVSFGNGTQVLSLSSADQPSENVLASTTPATITVAVPTAVPSATPSPTTQPTSTPGGGNSETTPTPAVSLTPSPTGTTSATQNPICTSFTADKTTVMPNGSVLFTANGTDPNTGGTLTKVTFNFGDGQVQDVTSSGGIGTATVNVQQSHTYTTNGMYTASATLTDNSGNISNPTSCSQTITVSNVIAGGSSITPTPMKKLAATGPGDAIMITGIVGTIIAVLGGVLAFGL